ncbi:MAG: oligosaccharide repeat unit polymerase [Gemmatimonadetes bacterium]|nr:oligosaccharide repeat unit polymerase [Gemmatimonadota bacterium]
MDSALGFWFTAMGALGYLLVFRRTGDALHPLGIMIGSWLGVFGFAHFDVARVYDEPYYAEPFEPMTYAVVVLSLVVFVAGFWLVDPGLVRLDRGQVARRLEESARRERLRWFTLGAFAVATVTTAYFVYRAGAIPLFSPRIDELRRVFKRPLLGYLFDLHYAVALFSAMLLITSRSRLGRLTWGLVMLAALLQLAFGGVRVSPMTGLAWVAVYLLYRPRHVRLRDLVVVVSAAVLMFSVIEYYRRSVYRLNPELVQPRFDLGVPATVWAHTAASFKNLQLTLRRVSPLNMGLNSYDLPKTVEPSWRAVDERFTQLFGTHNTPTYLAFLYFDFGLAGLLLMPGIYGALAAYVYRRFLTAPNLFWLIVYIDIVLGVGLAFRTHRFLGNALIFFAGVGVLAQLLVGRGRVAAPGRLVGAAAGRQPGAWRLSPTGAVPVEPGIQQRPTGAAGGPGTAG